MDEEAARKRIEQKRVEESIKQDCMGNASIRAARYLQVKPHGIISNQHFAPPSTECSYLFRDGHYYGCIALTQAVAEALVKFLCSKNSFRPARSFETNVSNLYKRQFISKEIRDAMLSIWNKRDSYHHLNHDIETDRDKLEELAKEKLVHLYEIENEIFKYTTTIEGGFKLKYPKYWDIME